MSGKTLRVFISSVARGMERHREAVCDRVHQADGFEVIAMEYFGARNESPEQYCRSMVATADVFVGIVGPLYGSVPNESDRSFSEIEYQSAIECHKKRLMFMSSDDFSIPAKLQQDQDKRELQSKFRKTVLAGRVTDTFDDGAEALAASVVTALHNLSYVDADPTNATLLRFPFVTNQAGFDTGIAISNMSVDPFEKPLVRSGRVSLHYFGTVEGGLECVESETSSVVPGGGQLVFTLSAGNAKQQVAGRYGFQGYLIAVCEFAPAGAYAFVTDGFGGIPQLSTGYLAEVLDDAYRAT